MDLHELQNDVLVDVVSDGFFDLLHVEIELLLGPGSLMGKGCEDLVDKFLRFYLLQEVGDHLVDEIRHNVSILIFPLDSEIKLHLFVLGGHIRIALFLPRHILGSLGDLRQR